MTRRLQHDVRVNGSNGDTTDGRTTRAETARTRSAAPARTTKAGRVRMTGKQRREQLLDIGRTVFAERGYDGTSVEEIAERAGVSKPVVYEHFGGKEGLYAVVVDREMQLLLDMVTGALTGDTPASCWSRPPSH